MSSCSSIFVTSPSDGDIFTYPLPIIRGKTTVIDADGIQVSGRDPAYQTSTTYPITDGKFTVQIHLVRGHNEIKFNMKDTPDSAVISLYYEPRPLTIPHIRLVYLLTSDSDGSFQSPDPAPACSDITEGLRRLQTAGLMIQSATAEMLHAEGLGRRTFTLSEDVHVHRIESLTTAEAHKKSDRELWDLIARDLSHHPRQDDVVDIAVMSFTRFIDNSARAHTALGGGPLALFGGGSLFTWPSSTRDIPSTLLDTRPFDRTSFFDDSAGRAAELGRRACTSTTIGALLHELGHCLSLPHPYGDACANGGGIMARGFDHLDRLFIQPRLDDRVPFWDRGSAVRLRYHRFLQFEYEEFLINLRLTCVQRNDSLILKRAGCSVAPSEISAMPSPTPSPSPQPSPELQDDSIQPESKDSTNRLPERWATSDKPSFKKMEDGIIHCHSPIGLGHIGIYRNDDNASHFEFLDTYPLVFPIPSLVELRRMCRADEGDKIKMSAIDLLGQIFEIAYHEVR